MAMMPVDMGDRSRHARNRSPEPLFSVFFGRIMALLDAIRESRIDVTGVPKTKKKSQAFGGKVPFPCKSDYLPAVKLSTRSDPSALFTGNNFRSAHR